MSGPPSKFVVVNTGSKRRYKIYVEPRYYIENAKQQQQQTLCPLNHITDQQFLVIFRNDLCWLHRDSNLE